MAIQRWDPVRDLVQLQEGFNRLFDDVLARSGAVGGAESAPRAGWRPQTDVFEEPARYVVRVDLPGVPPSDVDIEVEETALHVRGERRMDLGVPRDAYLRSERPQGGFAVSLQIPTSVDRAGIEAAHRDGVLEVVLPKRKDQGPARVKVDVR